MWTIKRRKTAVQEKGCATVVLVLIGLTVYHMSRPLAFTFQEQMYPMDRSEKYTVQIMTYRRPEALVETITYLMRAPSMDQVLVIWNDVNTPLSTTGLHKFRKIWTKPVKFIASPSNDVTTRWRWSIHCKTEAVFNIDDDTYINVDAIEAAFKVWKHFPDRVVGMYSRTIYFDKDKHSWVYALRERHVRNPSAAYGLIIGKAWFAGKKVMSAPLLDGRQLYGHLKQFLHDTVAERKGCDDIAWNMFLYKTGFPQPISISGLPILGVRSSDVTGYNVSSNRDKKGWLRYRNICVKDLMYFFNTSQPPLHPGLVRSVEVRYPLLKHLLWYQVEIQQAQQSIKSFRGEVEHL